MKRVMQYELGFGRELEIIVGFLLSVSHIAESLVLISIFIFPLKKKRLKLLLCLI